MDLKEKIIDHSKHIGIDLIGFTDAGPFEDLRQILTERKEQGKLSGFEEKDIELRVDPKKTLQGARSIIVIAMSYYIDKEKLQGDENPRFYGELARIAWGKDYHIVLMDKLEGLAEFIAKEYDGFEYESFVDTGPLVDRYLANRAGIGFYGYNSAIINENFGSWIFLGYMITNIPLEGDKPLTDKNCLGCNLCIEHCPTSAIEGPYEFDANKCLSNILQQRKLVSKEVLPIIGNKIYGCDICQDVCPHNLDIREMTAEEFMPVGLSERADLIRLLQVSNREFNSLFGENAAGWIGKKALQRNAIIALGNSKDKDAIPYLKPLLKDIRPDIRKITIWALYNIDPETAAKLVSDIRDSERDKDVLEIIDEYLNGKLSDS
ncbi:MAG: tRNA epoxyqueuosine(34) reductase QueG [Natronincolaceae bacterium]|jgi:epoxyqueuosine reductase|nr:tRNA epoxyqueuosine(34) reductase QueG [Bacillota bacterium]NLK90078.1 tRNA epoxyqueuosine(34) reductase QueG [Clostridiales bacterium]